MRRPRLLFLFASILLVSAALPTETAEAADPVNAPTSHFVFGVYTGWETTYIPGYTDTADNRAQNLAPFLTNTFFPVLTANNSFNLVWTTDGPESVSAEVSEFAAAAQQFGVMAINGSDGDLYLNESQNSNDFIASALTDLQTLWNGANPKPFAFSISDEPPPADASQLASYVKQAQALHLPVTTVLSPGTVSTILGSVQTLPWVSFDRYSFFSDPTSGPTGNNSYSFFLAMATDIGTAYEKGNPQVWAMGQAFQGVEGKYSINSDGTVTVSAGSGLEWAMPTPAQVSWQTWAAAAMGAKGIVLFCYSQIPQWVATVGNPPPHGASWAHKTSYNTGSYPALASFPAYLPGPQLLQMQNKTIPDIRSIENILLTSHTLINDPPSPTPVSLAGSHVAGDYINFLGAPGGVTYVAIVSSPQRTTGSMTLSLNKNVQSLVPLGNAPALHLSGRNAALMLPPGGGAVYQVIGHAANNSGGPTAGGTSGPTAGGSSGPTAGGSSSTHRLGVMQGPLAPPSR